MRIALVSDSHLAPIATGFNANWQAVRRHIARDAIDLTIHLGDITLDGFSDRSQHDHASSLTRDWPTPLLFLPGNHDIGDHQPAPHQPAAQPLDLDLLALYRARFGRDYWRIAAEGWWLIGLNAQLFGTDTAAEAEQWDWLATGLHEAKTRPVVLLLHKPLFLDNPAEHLPSIRYVPREPRRRLLELLAALDLRLVLSGHTHQYVDRVIAGVRHVWLPSTAYVFPDTMQERIGVKHTGLGLLALSGDTLRLDIVSPDGVLQHDLVAQSFYAEMKRH